MKSPVFGQFYDIEKSLYIHVIHSHSVGYNGNMILLPKKCKVSEIVVSLKITLAHFIMDVE